MDPMPRTEYLDLSTGQVNVVENDLLVDQVTLPEAVEINQNEIFKDVETQRSLIVENRCNPATNKENQIIEWLTPVLPSQLETSHSKQTEQEKRKLLERNMPKPTVEVTKRVENEQMECAENEQIEGAENKPMASAENEQMEDADNE